MPAPFWAFVIVVALVAALPLLLFAALLPVLVLAALSGLTQSLHRELNRLRP